MSSMATEDELSGAVHPPGVVPPPGAGQDQPRSSGFTTALMDRSGDITARPSVPPVSGASLLPPRATATAGPEACSTQHHPFEVLHALLRTTPCSSLANIMTSYSVANQFMFFPPIPSYSFGTDALADLVPQHGDVELPFRRPQPSTSSSTGGANEGAPRRIYIPWSHVHPDGSGRVLGRSPTWMRCAYGVSNYITCSQVDLGDPDEMPSTSHRAPSDGPQQTRTFVSAKPHGSSEEAPASSPPGAPLTALFGLPSGSPSVGIGGGSAEGDDQPRNVFAPTTFLPSGAAAAAEAPRGKKRRKLVLCFHGNATDCNMDFLAVATNVARKFRSPATILFVEYPGYGNRDGEPSAALIKCAAERVVQFVLSTSTAALTPDCVTLLAHSMGTGVCMHLLECITEAFAPLRVAAAARHDDARMRRYFVGAVILVSPFSSIRSVLVPTTDLEHTTDTSCVLAPPPPPNANAASVVARVAERTMFEEHYMQHCTSTHMFDGASAYRKFCTFTRFVIPIVARPDGAAPPSDSHWIYTLGSKIILDRFCSYHVAYEMQRRFDCFAYTTLVLIHGVGDETIPATHSLRLGMAVACGDLASGREDPSSTAQPRDSSPPRQTATPQVIHRVHTILLPMHDHNNIVGDLSAILDHAWPNLRDLPGLSPQYDEFSETADVVATASSNCVMYYGADALLTSTAARLDSEATLRLCKTITQYESAVFVLIGAWLLVCGVVHFVAARRHYDDTGAILEHQVPNSHVVVVWAALECTQWWLSAWVQQMEPRCAITFRSTMEGSGPTERARMIYYSMRALSGVLVVAIGAVFGFACAFSSGVCSSLSDEQWHYVGSTTNSAAMVTFAVDVTKWSMVGAAAVHGAQIAKFLLRHH